LKTDKDKGLEWAKAVQDLYQKGEVTLETIQFLLEGITKSDIPLVLDEIKYLNSENRHGLISNIILPFGKYLGKRFDEIPLKYLDETISQMPDCWITRMAREYVSLCMWFYMDSDEIFEIPNKSWEKNPSCRFEKP